MSQVKGVYDLAAVRQEWIGRRSPVSVGRYPVEYDPIRRHCHMVEDTNSLFLDPDYAATTEYGGVIAPPVMGEYFAGAGIWPPVTDAPRLVNAVPTRGARFINMNQTLEFTRPVRVGDRLSGQTTIADVYEKPIRLDPLAIWIVAETRLTNQAGELVTLVRNTLLVHRTPEEVAADTPEGRTA